MAKQKRKSNQNIRLVLISIVFITTVYLIIVLMSFFRRPLNIAMVRYGELINYENVTGYIIRNEEIIDNSNYSGKIKIVNPDATRVAKNETIVSYVSNIEDQLNEKIANLDDKIQVALNNQQTIFSNDAKLLDKQIETLIYDPKILQNDTYKFHELRNEIDEKIVKKAKIVGELSPSGSYIKDLIQERNGYEQEINESKKDLKADEAGLVSYRVDNFENILTPKSIGSLTIHELEDMKLRTGQLIPISNEKIKLVDNFECYLAIPMYSEESKSVKINDSVQFRFNDTADDLVPATVQYISEEENGRLIVFKITTHIEDLTKYRKINLDVVWWRYKGLKVTNDAIKQVQISESLDKTIPAVTIVNSNYRNDVFVKIVRQAGNFSIIDNYETSELEEMGLGKDKIVNQNEINMYDEVSVY
jgi:hypothetical protein